MSKFSEYEEQASALYELIRSCINAWSEEDKKSILQIDGYEYVVFDQNTDASGKKMYVTFCLGPKQMTQSEKDDLGYSSFTFDRCCYDVGGFAFDARDVVLSPPEDIVVEEMFASLEDLKRTFNIRIICASF